MVMEVFWSESVRLASQRSDMQPNISWRGGKKSKCVCLCSSINNTAVRKRFFFIQNENMRTTERKYINFHQHSYFCNLLCKLLDPWVGHAARWHWVFFTVMENSDLQAVHHNETKIGSLLGQTLESLHWKKATNFCSQVCKHFWKTRQ